MNLSGTTLDDPAYVRSNPADVDDALARLGCAGAAVSSLAEFYRRYAGPFTSEHTGFELLDLIDQRENVSTQTNECRREHGFPTRYLVLSNLLGNSVLVFDCQSGAVYDVDFEGGHEALKAGLLPPTWVSFDAFLESYFLGRAARNHDE